MTTYRATQNGEFKAEIRADSIEQAAARYARRQNRRYTVARESGYGGGSGFFQAYEPAPGEPRATSSIGDPFHITPAGYSWQRDAE